jgi:hypothetical protein
MNDLFTLFYSLLYSFNTLSALLLTAVFLRRKKRKEEADEDPCSAAGDQKNGLLI